MHFRCQASHEERSVVAPSLLRPENNLAWFPQPPQKHHLVPPPIERMNPGKRAILPIAVLVAYFLANPVFPHGDASAPVLFFLPLICWANIYSICHGHLEMASLPGIAFVTFGLIGIIYLILFAVGKVRGRVHAVCSCGALLISITAIAIGSVWWITLATSLPFIILAAILTWRSPSVRAGNNIEASAGG